MTRCICLDADARINELEKSPFLQMDWDGLRAIRKLNQFDIERDREANREASSAPANPAPTEPVSTASLTKTLTVNELFKTPRTMEEYWQCFMLSIKLHSPDVPEIQRKEMRRAFYGGMDCMMTGMTCLSEIPENKGITQLESWRSQIRAFAKDIQEGRA